MNLKSYLFFFILFQKILNIDYNDYTCSASNVKSEHGCLPYDSNSSEESETEKNKYQNHLPLFTGRCCNKGNGCYYESNMNPDYWKKNNISCYTKIEECNEKSVKNKNYSECTSFPVEPPYLCCYIGSKKYHECKALPMNDKKIFKQTKYWIRNKNKDYDGDYEIICKQFYLKIKIIFLLLSLIIIY